MKKKNVALLLLGVSNQHCGGAERFFSFFFSEYNKRQSGNFNLYLFTDQASFDTLHKLNKLHNMKNVVLLPVVSNRFKIFFENFMLRRKLRKYNIDLLHLCSYTDYYFPKMHYMDQLPKAIRPELVVNIVSARTAYSLANANDPYHPNDSAIFQKLFKQVKLDGVLAWNEQFKRAAESSNWIPSKPWIEFIRSRFIESDKYHPEQVKQKKIIFAGRLVKPKRPLLFLEGIRVLINDMQVKPEGWTFEFYGKGALEEELKSKAKEWNLENWVSFGTSVQMHEVLNSSTCFVSVQDYDNFPSLAINEAMAAGNVIIARDIGQTRLFVRENENGFLIHGDQPKDVAETLKRFLDKQDLHKQMMQASERIVKDEHTVDGFIQQIEQFWSGVFNRKAGVH